VAGERGVRRPAELPVAVVVGVSCRLTVEVSPREHVPYSIIGERLWISASRTSTNWLTLS